LGINPNDPAMQAIRARIARAVQELPALPTVVMRVLRETQNEAVSATHLEKLIGSDQAIASKALRIVNSAYYGMSKQVDSLSQAVVILGIQQLRNLVLSISAMSMIKAQTPTQRELHRRFWNHSLASAIGAQSLARAQRLPSTDQEFAYVAGLLHDIGRLFLFTNFTETYVELEKRACGAESLKRLEIETLGLTHAQVGQVLAHVWKFPERLADIMSDHEGPFDQGSQNPVAMCVHVAHLAANDIVYGEDVAEVPHPFVLQWLGMKEDDLSGLRNEIESKVKAYDTMYGQAAA
jgi:putative nucleotidyltransferase with HDIG domain